MMKTQDVLLDRARSPRQPVLLRGGVLIDGTGAPATSGDVLIVGEVIAEIGAVPFVTDALVVDCQGLVVSPGFIDVHSHSDLQVLMRGGLDKIRQGVTTEVVGNCGFSAFPAPAERQLLHNFANGILCGEGDWGWETAADYLGEVRRSAPWIRIESLVGHGTLRLAQAGHTTAALGTSDLATMEYRLAEAFEQGACGLSTGLMYAPGSGAAFNELEQLCWVVARHDKIYATHMRDYSVNLLAALDEQIDLARRTGCRLQVSHLQVAGRANWPLLPLALEKIEQAAADVDIAFDCYPYVAGCTVLTQILPQWALDGGIPGLLERLADSEVRARIAAETQRRLCQPWSDLRVCGLMSDANRWLIGRNMAELAVLKGCAPVEAALTLLEEERGSVNILEFNQSEENVRLALTHPLGMIASDGVYVQGSAHPRLYSTFPFLLGEICRERGWLTLTEAVRKISEFPARRFGLARRGRLARGYFADVTVFDPTSISGPGTYEAPLLPPEGIRYVLRGGKLVYP